MGKIDFDMDKKDFPDQLLAIMMQYGNNLLMHAWYVRLEGKYIPMALTLDDFIGEPIEDISLMLGNNRYFEDQVTDDMWSGVFFKLIHGSSGEGQPTDITFAGW